MKPAKQQMSLFPRKSLVPVVARHGCVPFTLKPSPAVTAVCPRCGRTIIVHQDLPGPGERHASEYQGKGRLCWECSFEATY